MARDWKSAYAALQARGEADFPPAALYYVLQLVRQAYREKGGSATPETLVESFRRRTRSDFGPLARTVLREWGITDPEKLGRAVMLLGGQGCLRLDPSDSAESFSGDKRGFLHD